MERFEVLSPAGDLENFYEAIRAGADAVYMGLSKFNARMKAGNINIEELATVVRYAHIKGVKVYITLNTLVSDGEMKEVVVLVRDALKCGVDAFIVQDYGIIGELKCRFPDIVLHGSTQLGVHNRYGAMIAKSLGLSRVVLSREATLQDIKDIRDNVDIELEVFVQGAMCVCFSGNCYLSSLKFGASGNRGECKQLCRLSYNTRHNNGVKEGYLLSPRDNCMIDYLDELISLGVVSFKIEGRLRRKGYVGVATSVYRDAVDDILKRKNITNLRYNDIFISAKDCGEQANTINLNNEKSDNSNKDKCIKSQFVFDYKTGRKLLQKVFSRGEFVSGYFDGNDVIDSLHNSHTGEFIGRVVSCTRFKDLYKIEINSNVELHQGDGLKFDDGNFSLGVGNVEYNGINYVVFGKNYVAQKTGVYRILDSELENGCLDKSLYRRLSLEIFANVGSELRAKVVCGEVCFEVDSGMCSEAKSRPITMENFTAIFDNLCDGFVVENLKINLGKNVFLPLSEIKNLKKTVVEKLIKMDTCLNEVKECDGLALHKVECSLGGLAIVDEKVSGLNIDGYEGIVFSPINYSLEGLRGFVKNYSKKNRKLFLRLPIVAMVKDLEIIDSMVEFAIVNKVALVIENIYGLYYISKGAEVWAGANMNITNSYSLACLKNIGVSEFIASIEKWNNRVSGTYKMCKGNRILMTMLHCPYKTLNHSGDNNGLGCDRCLYTAPLKLEQGGLSYFIRRYMVANCYFELVDSVYNDSSSKNFVDDRRGVYV